MDDHGHIHYMLLGRGGVAGIGEDVIAVPFRAATFARVEDGGWRVQLDTTGEQLENAPKLGEAGIADLSATDTLRERVDAYFHAGSRPRPRRGDRHNYLSAPAS